MANIFNAPFTAHPLPTGGKNPVHTGSPVIPDLFDPPRNGIHPELNSKTAIFPSVEPSHRNAITGLHPLMATHRIASSEIINPVPSSLIPFS